MPMTDQDRQWHAEYEALPEMHRDAINEAWRGVRTELSFYGLMGAADDRAEALIAAITRYVIESNFGEKIRG